MYDTAKQVISRDLEVRNCTHTDALLLSSFCPRRVDVLQMGDNIGSQFLASLCSGFCAAALGEPDLHLSLYSSFTWL